MSNELFNIRAALRSAPERLKEKKIAAGFDGFVDSIVKVVNHKSEAGATEFFKTIKEFGDYISGKSGSGFSLESEELFQKLGGNMPIMANAIAQMGVSVGCLGAFGIPVVQSAFGSMHPHCKLYSYTNPGFTTAMEFTDGKIMLAQMTDLNHADWSTITDTVGLPILKEIFGDAELVCLVNWSEPDHSNAMWRGLLDDAFADLPDIKQSSRQFFFDLSDCSKRSAEALTTALAMLKEFGRYGRVTLSLNGNEAGILYKLVNGQTATDNLQEIGSQLFNALSVSTLIIHTSKISLAWDTQGSYANVPIFITQPVVSTGAGDNFNAGFCVGQLIGLDTHQSLILANSTSNCYMKSGVSPTLSVLDNHISKIISSSL